LTVAPNVKAATTPAVVKAAAVKVTTQAVAAALVSRAVTPVALTATTTPSPNLLTGLLELVGLGPSAAPGAPTPLDNPLGWVVAAVTRRFGQPVSNVGQTLAAPTATTSLITTTSADPAAPKAAATTAGITREFTVRNRTGGPIVIEKYLPNSLTSRSRRWHCDKDR
jgi:hypothetical protein